MSTLLKFFINQDKIKVKKDKIKKVLQYHRPTCQRRISEERINMMKQRFLENFNPITPIYFCKLGNKRWVIDGQHRLATYKELLELHEKDILYIDIHIIDEQEIEKYFHLINDQMALLDVYRQTQDIKTMILETYDYFIKNYSKSFKNKLKYKRCSKPYIWDDVFMGQLTELVNPDNEYDIINKFDIKNSKEFINFLEILNKKYSEQNLDFLGCSSLTLQRIKKGPILYFGLFKNNWMDGITNFENLEPQIELTQSLRFACWNKYIGQDIAKAKCFCCNTIDIWQQQFEAGHVKARNKGGKNNIENLRPICSKCNREMGDSNMFDFMDKMSYKK